MSFKEIWSRIRNETEIKNMSQLAELVGNTQQNVSARKKSNVFPVEWAYLVGQKYGLLTEWIMTGEGPKNLSEVKHGQINFLVEIEEWLIETRQTNPEVESWFKFQFESLFPLFKEWKKRKEGAAGQNNLSASSKIANDNSK